MYYKRMEGELLRQLKGVTSNKTWMYNKNNKFLYHQIHICTNLNLKVKGMILEHINE